MVLSVSSFFLYNQDMNCKLLGHFIFNFSVFCILFYCSMAGDDRAFVFFRQVVPLSSHVGIVPRATILGANKSKLLSKWRAWLHCQWSLLTNNTWIVLWLCPKNMVLKGLFFCGLYHDTNFFDMTPSAHPTRVLEQIMSVLFQCLNFISCLGNPAD